MPTDQTAPYRLVQAVAVLASTCGSRDGAYVAAAPPVFSSAIRRGTYGVGVQLRHRARLAAVVLHALLYTH